MMTLMVTNFLLCKEKRSVRDAPFSRTRLEIVLVVLLVLILVILLILVVVLIVVLVVFGTVGTVVELVLVFIVLIVIRHVKLLLLVFSYGISMPLAVCKYSFVLKNRTFLLFLS